MGAKTQSGLVLCREEMIFTVYVQILYSNKDGEMLTQTYVRYLELRLKQSISDWRMGLDLSSLLTL